MKCVTLNHPNPISDKILPLSRILSSSCSQKKSYKFFCSKTLTLPLIHFNKSGGHKPPLASFCQARFKVFSRNPPKPISDKILPLKSFFKFILFAKKKRATKSFCSKTPTLSLIPFLSDFKKGKSYLDSRLKELHWDL